MLSLTRVCILLVLVFALALSIAFILHGETFGNATVYTNTSYTISPANETVYAPQPVNENYSQPICPAIYPPPPGCSPPANESYPPPVNKTTLQGYWDCVLGCILSKWAPCAIFHCLLCYNNYPCVGIGGILECMLRCSILSSVPMSYVNMSNITGLICLNSSCKEFWISIVIKPLANNTYETVVTVSVPGYPQSQYVVIINPYTFLPNATAIPIGPGNCTTTLVNVSTTTPITQAWNTAVTLIVGSGGSVVVSGNASGTYTGPTTTTTNVYVGSEVTLTAAPGSGYVFSQWLVNGSPISANPITLTINGPTTIEAVFRQVSYYVYVTVTNDSLGASWLITSSVSSVSGGGNVFNTQLRIGGPTDTITASITGNPSGYTCQISPTSVNAQAGNTYTFTINCISNTPTQTQWWQWLWNWWQSLLSWFHR